LSKGRSEKREAGPEKERGDSYLYENKGGWKDIRIKKNRREMGAMSEGPDRSFRTRGGCSGKGNVDSSIRKTRKGVFSELRETGNSRTTSGTSGDPRGVLASKHQREPGAIGDMNHRTLSELRELGGRGKVSVGITAWPYLV